MRIQEILSFLHETEKRPIEQDKALYAKIIALLLGRGESKERAKKWYVYTILVLTVFAVGGLGVIIWFLAQHPNRHTAAFITAVGGLVGSLFGLPRVAARYLFDPDEDKLILEQLKIREIDVLLQQQETINKASHELKNIPFKPPYE